MANNSRLWFNVPPPPANFVGREAELYRLHELMQEARVVGITGMFGVGKSALASQYLHLRASQGTFEGPVLWMNATSKESVLFDLRTVVTAFGTLDLSTKKDWEWDWVSVLCPAVMRTVPSKSIFVFDGLEESTCEEWLSSITPPPDGGIQVLVTTHQKYFLSSSVHLDVFKVDEALELLRNEAPDSSEGDARALAEVVGFLPVALQDAALTLRSKRTKADTAGYTLANFIGEHLDEDTKGTFLSCDGVPMATMRMLRDAVRPQGGDELWGWDSTRPLTILAALRPEGTTLQFLARFETEFEHDECTNTSKRLEKLEASSLVTINKEQSPRRISLHPVLRKMVRTMFKAHVQTPSDVISYYLGEVISAGKHCTFVGPEGKKTYDEPPPTVQKEYLLQSAHLLKSYIADVVLRRTSDRCLELFSCLHDGLLKFGLTAEAEFVAAETYAFLQLEEKRKGHFGNDSGPKIQLKLRLAKFHMRRNANGEALRLLEELPFADSKHGLARVATADQFLAVCLKGNAHCALGQLKEAEQKLTEGICLLGVFDMHEAAGDGVDRLIPLEFLEM